MPRRNALRLSLLAGALLTFLALIVPAAPAAPAEPRDPTPDIIGGGPAPAGSWPFIAALLSDESGDAHDDLTCGGSLIRPSWVLTAAHCSDPASVLLGSRTLDADLGETIPVETLVRHEDFFDASSGDDIMLLKLAWPAEIATPITLVDISGDPPVGSSLAVAGWGDTDPDPDVSDDPYDLQQTTVKVVASDDCQSEYDADESTISWSMLCATDFDSDPARDSCQGDSGGPLVKGSGSSLRLVGITSWGHGCAEEPYPGVYTRVSSFLDWINAQLTRVQVDSEELNAGLYWVNERSSNYALSFTHVGADPVTITALNNQASGFNVASDGCSGVTLAPGESCTIEVYFEVDWNGDYGGSIQLQAAGRDLLGSRVDLSATSLRAQVTPRIKLLRQGPKRRRGRAIKTSYSVSYDVPFGMPRSVACTARLSTKLKVKGLRRSWTRPNLDEVGQGPSSCVYRVTYKLPASARGRKATLTARSDFTGIAIYGFNKRFSVRIGR